MTSYVCEQCKFVQHFGDGEGPQIMEGFMMSISKGKCPECSNDLTVITVAMEYDTLDRDKENIVRMINDGDTDMDILQTWIDFVIKRGLSETFHEYEFVRVKEMIQLISDTRKEMANTGKEVAI